MQTTILDHAKERKGVGGLALSSTTTSLTNCWDNIMEVAVEAN